VGGMYNKHRRNVYRIFMIKSEGKKPPERSGHRVEDYIKMNL
jgi:hypothetical protein